MSIFNRTNKEMKQKMLIKQTINDMNKQIAKLENNKQVYINAGSEAKKSGLTSQYNLAVTGLRMTIMQQKRVKEMKLNFEIVSQMKDMSKMTADFLKGMSAISNQMLSLTKDVDFAKVSETFNKAMMDAELQAERMEDFMNDTETNFNASANMKEEEKAQIESLINNVAGAGDENVEESINKELEELKKRMM